MTTYNVTIDEETIISMLKDRMEVWVKSYEPAYQVYEGLITELVEDGYFEGMKEFDPMVIIDNLYINDTSFYDSVDDAIRDGYEEGDIAYLDEDTGCVLIWA